MITQSAPQSSILEDLISKTSYKNWSIRYIADYDRGGGCVGASLVIVIDCVDTYHPTEEMRIRHTFGVPAATYNEQSWRRWLFDRVLDVERHEAMEFFIVAGERPYAPNHGPGNDPYFIFEEGTKQRQRTSYLGIERSGDDPTSEKPEGDASYRRRLSAVVEGRDDARTVAIANSFELDVMGDRYNMKRWGRM